MEKSKSRNDRLRSGIFDPVIPVEATRRIPGAHTINARVSQPHTKSGGLRTTAAFDPVNSKVVVAAAPALPPMTDSLNPYRRLDSRQRDTATMEHAHRAALARDPRAFYRLKGDSERYLDAAAAHSDMLVWQSAQARDEATTSLLNRLNTRPYSEAYDHPSWALANTYRGAQSPLLAARHSSAQMRRLRFEVTWGDPIGLFHRGASRSLGDIFIFHWRQNKIVLVRCNSCGDAMVSASWWKRPVWLRRL